MRRWHAERDLMLRRWRQEIAKHEGIENQWPYLSLAPVPPENDGDCHCYLGMGFLRKRTPFGCPNGASCWVCHDDKYWASKNRGNERRDAIRFDLAAS